MYIVYNGQYNKYLGYNSKTNTYFYTIWWNKAYKFDSIENAEYWSNLDRKNDSILLVDEVGILAAA